MSKILSDLSKELQWEIHYHEVTAETFGKIVDLSDQIDKEINKEVNSKPTMPKIFDDWYKDVTAESSDIQGIITFFNSTIDGEYNSYEPERELYIWVHSGEYNRVLGMNLVDENRYKRCLEAILYGYEVEK